MRDLGCVVHVHSVHSDGTGTVAEIARAAARAGADAVLLTDHDTLTARWRREDGWLDGVLVVTGHEISPRGRDHMLAFGIDEVVRHDGRDARAVADAVRDLDGLGVAAHPWSARNPHLQRWKLGGMPFGDLSCVDAVELWSIVTDSAEQIGSLAQVAGFICAPDRWLTHPPGQRMAAYDALTAERRVVAIGGLDAHQVGVRAGPWVPFRLMSYERTFRLLRTRVLLDDGVEVTERTIVAALRAGHCYLARDSLAPAQGFALWAQAGDGRVVARTGDEEAYAEGLTLHARLPRPATIVVRRNGAEVARMESAVVGQPIDGPGAWRVEATLPLGGRRRTWIVANPVYLR